MTSVRALSLSPSGRRAAMRVGLLGILALIPLGLWIRDLLEYLSQPDRSLLAVDFTLYRDAAARWLSGGGFYLPRQLAGPYDVTPGDVLYPPYAIPLFVAFTALPAVLWWLIPMAGTTAIVAWHRPRPESWPLLALCLWFPPTSVKIVTGNPVLWAVLAVALGTVWRWPGVLALIKPSLLPFALVGAWRRSWWLALGAIALVSVAFAPLWPDFATALLNSRQAGGLLYSIQEAPMMALPLVAWIGGRWWPARGPAR